MTARPQGPVPEALDQALRDFLKTAATISSNSAPAAER